MPTARKEWYSPCGYKNHPELKKKKFYMPLHNPDIWTIELIMEEDKQYYHDLLRPYIKGSYYKKRFKIEEATIAMARSIIKTHYKLVIDDIIKENTIYSFRKGISHLCIAAARPMRGYYYSYSVRYNTGYVKPRFYFKYKTKQKIYRPYSVRLRKREYMTLLKLLENGKRYDVVPLLKYYHDT